MTLKHAPLDRLKSVLAAKPKRRETVLEAQKRRQSAMRYELALHMNRKALF